MRIIAYHVLTMLSKLRKVRAVSSVQHLGVHMEISELESMINDGAVTDETIFEALKVVVADKFDADKRSPRTECGVRCVSARTRIAAVPGHLRPGSARS